MFGILDYTAKFPLEKEPREDYQVEDTSIPGEPTWISFLPSFAFNSQKIRKNLAPQVESRIVYKLPYPSITTNPQNIKDYLDRMYSDARERIERLDQGPLSILGVSLGNTLAFKIANDTQSERLFSVTPGANIPRGIYTSHATRDVHLHARHRGTTHSEFKEALRGFSPEENTANLPPHIEIHLARWDKMVPYRTSALPLMQELYASQHHPSITLHRFKGHVATIYTVKNNH